MLFMKLKGIQKSFGDNEILKNINLEIQKGDRIGIVGNNGTGKTTLANIIAGKLIADKGSIEAVNENVTIGYLVQATDYTLEEFSEALLSTAETDILEKTSRLGLSKMQKWDASKVQNLSGGEKTKLSLAKIWSMKPDFLILDEPTNHLDFAGVEWLVNEIEKFVGTVLIISHDRYFLDQTVQKILEVEHGESTLYTGNYSSYREEKERRYQVNLHQYETQQKFKEQIELQMANLQQWSQKAHSQSTKQEGFKEYHRVKAKKLDKQVKSKMKRLEKELEKNKVDKPLEKEEVRFNFKESHKRGKRIIEIKNGKKEFPGKLLFGNSHFYIKYGERIGILGENGCGKSTLLRILMDQDELSSGELWKSDSLKIGYLSQEVTDLDEEITALDYLGLTEKEEISKARTILANIGLSETKVSQPISTLSLGQRTRLKLVKILVQEVDLLILDEPTNHLDLMSREMLENTLLEFEGTILTVSHDRYFLEKMCDKLLVFESKQLKRVEMSLEEYQKRENTNMPNKEREEELLVLGNEISMLLGKLSLLSKDDPSYQELDSKFLELTRRKRALLDQK
ncbi:ribosomal protection-like ABC-F family protein [Fredinandcohnia humi]